MTLTAIAKRLDDISARLGSVQSDTTSLSGQVTSLDQQFKSLSGQVTSLDQQFKSLSGQVSSLDGQVKSLDGQFKSLDGQFKSLDGKLTALDHKMTIEFEATRGLINLGFENVQMLDEKVDRRFDETQHDSAGHRSVLEAAIVDLRRDVTKPRRPGRRS